MDSRKKEIAGRFFKFGLVGASGILVNQGILYLFHGQLLVPLSISSPIAIFIAIYNNFTWNDLWTWAHNRDNRHHTYVHRLSRYYISAALGAIINYVTLLILKQAFSIHYLIANLAGIGLGMISNFIFGEFWVFKSQRTEKRP